MTAQLLNVTPDEYHARPGFSSTIAKTLISRSPLHARQLEGKEPTKEMDRGTVVHTLVLGKGKSFEVLNFDDFRTKAAQSARDAARAKGLVPILEHVFADANQCAEAIRVGLAERGLLLDGESEAAVEWHVATEHGPVLCRAMFDHVWIDRGVILDLKITANAAPVAIERTSENLDYAIQYAAYTSALVALRPDLAGRTDFLFVFAEPESPYALNVTRPDGVFRELGERRWSRAVTTWAQCLATGKWPSYGTGINPLSPPAWALTKEEFAL